MENNNMPEGVNEYSSSYVVFGWLLIIFAFIPLLIWLSQRSTPALITGGIIAVFGLLLVLFGRNVPEKKKKESV